jgi:hypothetical protein
MIEYESKYIKYEEGGGDGGDNGNMKNKRIRGRLREKDGEGRRRRLK